MKTLLKKFLRNDSGAALVEYGVALLVVILVGAGALLFMAQNTNTLFTGAQTSTAAAVTAAGGTPAVAPE
jgi:pilus assembly protein Flp/PilA